MDHLMLGELSGAWAALRGHDPDAHSLEEASAMLRESLAELRAAGLRADGEVIPGDPIAALVQTIDSAKSVAVVFVTRPHLLGDALHEDWSAKARRTLGVPVIHFYSGTAKLLS
jgi:predicted RNase H-like HicB family nuclease